jgi:maltoporin
VLIKDVHEDVNNGNVFSILHFMSILMTIEWLMIYGVTYCKCVDHDYDNSNYAVVDVVVYDAEDYDGDTDET